VQREIIQAARGIQLQRCRILGKQDVLDATIVRDATHMPYSCLSIPPPLTHIQAARFFLMPICSSMLALTAAFGSVAAPPLRKTDPTISHLPSRMSVTHLKCLFTPPPHTHRLLGSS
jgi:hypothetical protein